MSQQYPHNPPYPQPQPPKKNWFSRHKILTAIGGTVAVIVVLSAVSGGGDDTKESSASTTPAAQEKNDDAPAAEEKKPEPPKKEEKSYGDGDHKVGTDIPAGDYVSAGAKKGLFEFCGITTAPLNPMETMTQAKTAGVGERILIKLTEADNIVTIQGCEPLKPQK